MALYYLPLLIRSDRYFIARLENDNLQSNREPALPAGEEVDYNFVVHADDLLSTPLLTIEDPDKIVLNQMAPPDPDNGSRQDILLRECHISLTKKACPTEGREN